MLLFAPVNAQSATERSAIWISCEECKKSTSSAVSWRCQYGCDRYFTNVPNVPVSITKPTPGTGNTAKGSYLDCKDCFGHGNKPHRDPRCKYGCGRFMTFPPYYKKNRKEEEKIKKNEKNDAADEKLIQNVKADKSIQHKNDEVKTKHHLNFQYKHLVLLVGLCVVASAICVGLFMYFKRPSPPKTTATVQYAADNAVVEIQET